MIRMRETVDMAINRNVYVEVQYVTRATKATSVLKQEMLNNKHCIMFSSAH